MNIARGLHTTVTNLRLRSYRGKEGGETTESGRVKDDCTHEIKPLFVSGDFWNVKEREVGRGGWISSLFCGQNKGHDQTVKTQDFSENEDQDHAYK